LVVFTAALKDKAAKKKKNGKRDQMKEAASLFISKLKRRDCDTLIGMKTDMLLDCV
jgi:hypothetical protein